MLRPCLMSKITVACTQSMLPKVVREMHSLKAIHITEHTRDEFADIGKPFENAAELADLLVKAKSLIANLSVQESRPRITFKNYADVKSSLHSLYGKISDLVDKLRSAEEELARITAFKERLNVFAALDIPLEAFSSYISLSYFVFFVKNIEPLREKIVNITDKFEIHVSKADKQLLVALFVDKEKENEVRNLLDAQDIALADTSVLIGMEGTVQQNIKKAEESALKLEKAISEMRKKLHELGKRHTDLLNSAAFYLETELEKAEAPLRFAETKEAAVVKGWLPANDLDKAVGRLKDVAKGKIHIVVEQPSAKDNVPIKLENPNPAKPFEFLLRLYSLPMYGEFDPTVPTFLIFPMFFGFMLGDIGYGLLGFVIAFSLKKYLGKGRAVASLMNIVMLSSFVSIVFGALFGEFFGSEHIAGFELPHILSRIEDIYTLIYIAVGIGVIHINIGLVLGFINESKLHGIAHGFYTKISWMILQLGALSFVLPYLKIIDVPSWIGYLLLAFSVLMIIKGESFLGIIELPSIFSNILSYARLGAIGLSSVILAVIVNDLVSFLFRKGGLFLLIGLIAMFVGHALNLALGMFESFLHSLRLHYVEFFTKFYKGGGIEYIPFGTERQKTLEQ